VTNNNTPWTTEEIIQLKKYVEKIKTHGLSYGEIGEKLGRSSESVRKKVRSLKNMGEQKSKVEVANSDKWTKEEISKLAVYLKSGFTYKYISGKINRSYSAVKNKAQSLTKEEINGYVSKSTKSGVTEAELVEKFAESLMALSRNDIESVKEMTKEYFYEYLQIQESDLPVPFAYIKKHTISRLVHDGYQYPLEKSFGEGRYIVVGDSHGKHTDKGVVAVIKNLNTYLYAKKVIHVGHMTDDDNHINTELISIPNLVTLAKIEEVKLINEALSKIDTRKKADEICKPKSINADSKEYEKVRGAIKALKNNDYKKCDEYKQASEYIKNIDDVDIEKLSSTQFSLDVVREKISLGNCSVFNQNMIGDYTIQPLNGIDESLVSQMSIVNLHRHELFTRCTYAPLSYIASPGCLCNNHVVRTVKQQDFLDHRIVKLAYHEGFQAYRRKRHMSEYWEKGAIVVEVNSDGSHSIHPIRIKMLPNGKYATAYFDKIITEDGICEPDEKIFITADAHSSMHDPNTLATQEKVVLDFTPSTLVNLGDLYNNESLNHHKLDRGECVKTSVLSEGASAHFVAKKMRSWAKKAFIIKGNHERFSDDFINKNIQFSQLLSYEFLCGLKELDYETVDLKKHLNINGAKFIHGDTYFYSQKGSKLEKASRTYGKDIFVGHIHKTAIRFGAYAVGLSGLMNQEYNEVEASAWNHGFGLCLQKDGVNFCTSLILQEGLITINGKKYLPTLAKEWEVPSFECRINYVYGK
jgi:predicted phosphodiesterase